MIMFKCPKCISKEITQIMCPKCHGDGRNRDDHTSGCGYCDGYGYIINEFKCLNCGHFFPHKDLL